MGIYQLKHGPGVLVGQVLDTGNPLDFLSPFDALLPLLDDKLVALPAEFVHDHLGIDLGAARSSR